MHEHKRFYERRSHMETGLQGQMKKKRSIIKAPVETPEEAGK